MLPTDRQLVNRSLTGDRQAFIALHRRHAPRVYRLLCRLTSHLDAAQDLTQETFIAAFRTLNGWRGESAFSAWVCGIAIRQYRNYQRRTAGKGTDLLQDDVHGSGAGSDPFEIVSHSATQELIDKAIGGLPDASREVFVLIRIEGLSYREASELLDIPLGTVQSRLSYATRLLRSRLACLEDETAGSDIPIQILSRKVNPDAL